MNQEDNQKGFTIVELLLAMAFVSALLLAVALTAMQVTSIYHKGVTLKSVNQAGTAIGAELQRSISSSISFDKATNYVENNNVSGVKVGGRLCLGQYTYIWNRGVEVQNGTEVNKYSGTGKIYFIKVYDPTAKYCFPPANGLIDPADATELLNSDNGKNPLLLAVYDFALADPIKDATINQRLYNIQFTLGTSDAKALNTRFDECKVSGVGEDFTYCFVNKFDIIARSGNDL